MARAQRTRVKMAQNVALLMEERHFSVSVEKDLKGKHVKVLTAKHSYILHT